MTTNVLRPAAPLVQPVNGSFDETNKSWGYVGSVAFAENAVCFNGGDRPPNGSISTLLTTEKGHTYVLTYDVGTIAFNNLEQRLLVTLESGNVISQQVHRVSGDGKGVIVWTNQTLEITAQTNTTHLSFQDTSEETRAIDTWIDNVQFKAKDGRSLDWTLLKEVPATNGTIFAHVDPLGPARIFIFTVSNVWGEQSISENHAPLPVVPTRNAKTKIEKSP